MQKMNCGIVSRRLWLGSSLLVAALAVTACGGGDKNVRDDNAGGHQSSTDRTTGQGQQKTQRQDSHQRDIDERGLEGIPEGDREKFVDPNNPLSTRTIYFDFDTNKIASKYDRSIQAHAKYLSEHRDVKLRLEGNTDERGTREYNVALGERRAEAVRQALIMSGANDGQVSTISYGEERPAVMGHSEEAYSKNRRVDFIYPRRN